MTTATVGQKLLTAADLLRLSGKGVKGELVRGVLRETMSVGGEHGEVAGALIAEIRAYVRPRRMGRVGGSDAGVLLERDPDTVREPDAIYIAAEKLPLDVKVRGYYEVVPDLVAEVVSPSDRPREVAARIAMWHSYGVPLVWAVYPALRTVAEHPLGGTAVILGEADLLDGGAVIPGFQCLVRDILDP